MRSTRVLAIAAFVTVLGLCTVRARPVSTRAQARSRGAAAPEPSRLDVSVLGRDGHPIHGLAAADFSVRDGATALPVVGVDAIDAPVRSSPAATWMVDVPPDVATNVAGSRRIVVLLLDNVMPSTRADLGAFVAVTARRVVEDLAPGDLAAIIPLGAGRSQSFTTDRARLLAAVDGLGTSHDGGDLGQAIRGAIAALATIPDRRKTILYVGAGVSPDAAPSLKKAAADLVRDAAIANVTCFALEPDADRAADRSAPDATASRRPRAHDAPAAADALETLAIDTGGRVVRGSRTMDASVAAVLDESGSYYMLAIQPGAGASNEADVRPLTITVHRPDVVIRARTEYAFATARGVPGRPPLTLARALAAPLPVEELPLAIVATPFAGAAGAHLAAAITIRVTRVPAAAAGATAEVLTAALDATGHVSATTREVVDVPAAPAPVAREAATAAAADGTYEIFARVPIDPGAGEIRVAVQQGRAIGSVFMDLTAPDTARDAISLSGLALSRAPADPAAPAAVIADLVPIVPTSARAFRPSDDVRVFARVYQGGHEARLAVASRLTIVDMAGAVVADETNAIAADEFRATRFVELREPLPLARLAPGDYLLRVEARRGPDVARREARFAVRE